VGLFKEEEERTGVASDVVKVQGEDPDTPGYLRGPEGQGEVGTSAISDRGCISLGSLTIIGSPRTVHNNSTISV